MFLIRMGLWLGGDVRNVCFLVKEVMGFFFFLLDSV